MSETITSRADHVCVAIGLDEQSGKLAEYGAQLARLLNQKLCLLHVVEPWLERPHSTAPVGARDTLWDVTQAVEANARELATAGLRQLEATIPRDVTVVHKVVRGRVAASLCDEALTLGSSLLLVASSHSRLKFIPQGLSTTLSVMVGSPVPVMVIKTAELAPLRQDGLTIIVADDLSPQSENALELGFDLALAGRRSKLFHVHINAMTLEGLRAGLTTAAASAHSPLDETLTSEMVFEAYIKSLEEALESRSSTQRDYLETHGGIYYPKVVSGPVIQKMSEMVETLAPDVIIFGRHQSLHQKPMLLGRMPFKTMLTHHVPIIVAPPA